MEYYMDKTSKSQRITQLFFDKKTFRIKLSIPQFPNQTDGLTSLIIPHYAHFKYIIFSGDKTYSFIPPLLSKLLIIQMERIKQQQEQSIIIISSIVDSILIDDILAPIRVKTLAELVSLCKTDRQVKHIITLIKNILERCQYAAQRLKILLIARQVLFSANLAIFFSQINSILNNYEKTLSQSLTPTVSLQKIQDYLKANVELPFVQFVRKVMRWKYEEQLAADELHYTDKGFSQLNKIKSAFQLRIIFHNYSTYFKEHRYAGGMFRLVVKTIYQWWKSVCEVAKDIITEAIATNDILHEDYLFLKEADSTQDLLIDFIYTGNFKKKIQRISKFKHLNFIPEEVSLIYLKITKQKSSSLLYNMGKNSDKEYEENTKTRYSDSFLQGPIAEDRTQILQSIITLQSFLRQI